MHMIVSMARKRPAPKPAASGRALTDTAGIPVADSAIAPARLLHAIRTWALLFFAALIAYWPALQGGMLWDDAGHITRPDLQSLNGLWRIWSDLHATQQYYPLLHSAFWLQHQLWGDAVLGYHLTNLAEHAGSAALVVFIMRRLRLPGAWLGGLLFTLHPIYVEGVAWMSEQKSTLSGLFCLAAALAYLHFDEKRRARLYWLASCLFICAVLSKSVTALLPVALLVVIWWQKGRLEVRKDFAPLAAWLALGASMGLFTAWVERNVIGATGTLFELTPLQHILLAGRIICFYAFKLVWPQNLTFSYPRWTVDPAVWWQYLFPAVVLVAAIALARLARTRRGPLASLLIFVAMLFPVLGFLHVLPFRFSWVADHFEYLASLAILIPAASLIASAGTKYLPGRAADFAIPAMLLAALTALTWQQTAMYRDEETLYRETVARDPDSRMAHNNLGKILLQRPGGLTEATHEFEETLRVSPDFPESHMNLGIALTQSTVPADVQRGIQELETAVKMKPDLVDAYVYLGAAYQRQPEHMADAAAAYTMALRYDPDNVTVHSNLGNIFVQADRMQLAIPQFEAVARLTPDSAEAHANLGSALAQMPERLPDAVKEFQAALKIRPDLAALHYNLGMILTQMPDRKAEGVAELQAALRLDPQMEPAKEALAEFESRH